MIDRFVHWLVRRMISPLRELRWLVDLGYIGVEPKSGRSVWLQGRSYR